MRSPLPTNVRVIPSLARWGVLLCLLLGSSAVFAAKPKVDCKRSAAQLVENPVYPGSVSLAALGRTVKLNQGINLNKLSKKEIGALIEELARRNLLVEVAGHQGIVKSVSYFRQNGYQHVHAAVKEPIKTAHSEPIRLMDFQTGKFYSLKIIAAPTQLPKTPLFVRETKLEEDFKETGLKESDRTLIETHSRGLVTFSDFLREPKFNGGAKANKGTMLLGNDDFFYRQLADQRGYEVFETVYGKYFEDGTLKDVDGPWDSDKGPLPEVTERFMSDIGGYRKIFLLPKDFKAQAKAYGRRGGYTWVEWQWLSTHPEEMNDTLFVVGLDNALGPTQRVQVGSQPNRVHLRQLFQNPEPYVLK